VLNPIRQRILKTGRLRRAALTQFFCPFNTHTITGKENRRISISAVTSAHPTRVSGNVTHGLRSVVRREDDFSRLAMTMTPNKGKRFQIFDVLMKISF
jgi:hypothetical protein